MNIIPVPKDDSQVAEQAPMPVVGLDLSPNFIKAAEAEGFITIRESDFLFSLALRGEVQKVASLKIKKQFLVPIEKLRNELLPAARKIAESTEDPNSRKTYEAFAAKLAEKI